MSTSSDVSLDNNFKLVSMGVAMTLQSVVAFHTPGGERGRNLQATRCFLGGKSRVKVVTLLLNPPFKQTPNKDKGGIPYKLLRMFT